MKKQQNKQRRPEPFIEIPSSPQPANPERVPPVFDPMGSIYTESRAFRTLGGGNVKWWVLISGWLTFGSIFLLFALLALSTHSYGLIFPLAIAGIPLISLARGTAKKLAQRHRRR